MREYETNYPEAYGRDEAVEARPAPRRFFRLGLPRQVRDAEPALAAARRERPTVVDIDNIAEPAPPPEPPPAAPRHFDRARRPLVERPPREICDDVHEQLHASPFIDAAGIAIAVDNSEVTLDGTINSLIAIALAKALASNVPGVSRVQVRLRVERAPRR